MFYLCKIFHSEEIYCTAFIFKNSLESLFRLSQQKLKQGKCLLQIQVNRQHNSTSMHRVTNELVLKFRRNYGEKKNPVFKCGSHNLHSSHSLGDRFKMTW